ncbi:hypothetical protein ACFLS8_03345 [Chloroflexota bacterium]
MPDTCEVGDSFYITDDKNRHRNVVITKPNKNGKIVIVSFTDAASQREYVVLFQPKDDERLFYKLTTVAYFYAKLADTTKLTKHRNNKNNGYCRCKPEHVKRIIKGAFRSEFIPLEIANELIEQYPTEYAEYCGENIVD